MLLYLIVIAAAPLIISAAAAAIDTRFVRRDFEGGAPVIYTGDGSIEAGWPSMDQWISSFDVMFILNAPAMRISCEQWAVAVNSEDEIENLRTAITEVADDITLDPRMILAVVMQESRGCVRVPTSFGAVSNPGLMQSHAGQGTCNSDGVVQVPCPFEMIEEMILDGSAGSSLADTFGLKFALQEAGGPAEASSYYKAARIYNSGSIAFSGLLENGLGATDSYASDIANRLTGALIN